GGILDGDGHASGADVRRHDVDLGGTDEVNVCRFSADGHADIVQAGGELPVDDGFVPGVGGGGEIGALDGHPRIEDDAGWETGAADDAALGDGWHAAAGRDGGESVRRGVNVVAVGGQVAVGGIAGDVHRDVADVGGRRSPIELVSGRR